MRARSRALIAALAIGLSAACSGAPVKSEAGTEESAAKTPRELLEEDIREGAGMLERGESRAFLNRFVHPDERARFEEEFDNPEALAAFEQDHAVVLATVLEYLASERPEPELSEDETKATYALPESLGAPRSTMVFGRVGGDWYIFN
jgi:hypothetical protein